MGSLSYWSRHSVKHWTVNMSGSKRVAVVTGSNKGIGYAVVRGLCKQFDGDVYVTARNVELGLRAVEDLKIEGCNAKFYQLDITKQDTIHKLKIFLQDSYGGLDILVNNAGISYKKASTASFSEQAEVTTRTNFTGTLDVCDTLFPILRSNARVVNISGRMSLFALRKCSEDLQKTQVDRDCITIADIKNLMQQFVDSAKTGTYGNLGWPEMAYGVSKLGVTVLSIIQQRNLLLDARPDIIINTCCPGLVMTDMSSQKGTKTIDEGADTPLYLALLPPNTTSPKGEFVSDRTIVNLEISKTED